MEHSGETVKPAPSKPRRSSIEVVTSAVYDGIQTLMSSRDKDVVKQRLRDLKDGQQGLFKDNAHWDVFMISLLFFTATVTPYEGVASALSAFD
jgi:hypothetical protein